MKYYISQTWKHGMICRNMTWYMKPLHRTNTAWYDMNDMV